MRIWSFICGWLKPNCQTSMADGQRNKRVANCKVAQRLLAACLLGLIATTQGAENETKAETEPQLPDLEFLEFLGQFETDEGEWIAPGSLMAEEFELLLEATIRASKNEHPNDDGTDNDRNLRRNNR